MAGSNSKRRGGGNYDKGFNSDFVYSWLDSPEGKNFMRTTGDKGFYNGRLTERAKFEAKRQYHSGWRPTRKGTSFEKSKGQVQGYSTSSKSKGAGMTALPLQARNTTGPRNYVQQARANYVTRLGAYERFNPVKTYADNSGVHRVKTGKGDQTRWLNKAEVDRGVIDRSGNANVWRRGKQDSYGTGETMVARNTKGHIRANNATYNATAFDMNRMAADASAARMANPMNGMGKLSGIAKAIGPAMRGLGMVGGVGGVLQLNEVMDHIHQDKYLRQGERQADGSWVTGYGDDNSLQHANYVTTKNGNRAVNFGAIARNGHFVQYPDGRFGYYLGDPRQYGSNSGFGAGMASRMATEPLTPEIMREIQRRRPDISDIIPNGSPNPWAKTTPGGGSWGGGTSAGGGSTGYLREDDRLRDGGDLPGVTIVGRKKGKAKPISKPGRSYAPISPVAATPMAPIADVALPSLAGPQGAHAPVAPLPAEYIDELGQIKASTPDMYRYGEYLSPEITLIEEQLRRARGEGLFALGYNPYMFM